MLQKAALGGVFMVSFSRSVCYSFYVYRRCSVATLANYNLTDGDRLIMASLLMFQFLCIVFLLPPLVL